VLCESPFKQKYYFLDKSYPHKQKSKLLLHLRLHLHIVLMQLRFSNGDVFPRPRSGAVEISSRQTLHTFSGRPASFFNKPTFAKVNEVRAEPLPVFGRRGDMYVTAEARRNNIFLDPPAQNSPTPSSPSSAGATVAAEYFPNYGVSVWNGMREGVSSVNVSSTTSVPQIQNWGGGTDPAIEQGNYYMYNYALGEMYTSIVERLALPLYLQEAYVQPCPVGTAEDAQGNCTVTSLGVRLNTDFGPKVLLRNDYALGISNNGSYIQYRCSGNGTRAAIRSTNTDGTLDVVCVQCSDRSTPSAQGTCAASVTAHKITPRYTSMHACPQGTAEDAFLNCTITENGDALGLPLQGEWQVSSSLSSERGLWQCSEPGTYAYLRTVVPATLLATCMYCPNFEAPQNASATFTNIPVAPPEPQCPAYEAVYYNPCPAGTFRGERGTCLRYSNCPAGSQPLLSNPAFCMVTQDEQFLQGNAPRTSRTFAPPNALLAARSVAGQGSTFPPWRAHIVGGTNAASISRL